MLCGDELLLRTLYIVSRDLLRLPLSNLNRYDDIHQELGGMDMIKIVRGSLSSVLCFVLLLGLYAQDAPENPRPAQDEQRGDARSRALELLQGRERAPEKPKTFEEVVKDHEKIEGLFTFYRKKNDLYMEIRPDQLGELYMLQATSSTGTSSGLVAGVPINDFVVRIEKVDEQIRFTLPNINYRAPEGTPTERAVRRSFADSILTSFKVEATHPEHKTYLIKVDTFLLTDFNRIGSRLAAGPGNYVVDRDKTFFDEVKAFPLNTVFRVSYTFNSPGSGLAGAAGAALTPGPRTLIDSRSVPIKMTYNLFALPVNNGYQPRLNDPRVGYFTADFTDFAKDKTDNQQVRYILRWKLEKADPNAAMSPPKEPIVFYLDNAIPMGYRDALREGILMWNKAFEKVGIQNAIEVKQMPDDADWDHADMRYNILRWVTSPASGYAVAQFRENPLTGQILNASITFDANMARFSNVEYDQVVENAKDWLARMMPPAEPTANERCCDYAAQMRNEAAIGYMAMELLETVQDRQGYVHQYLREVAAHEMGHILGLRHNFIASNMLSIEQAHEVALTQQKGIVSSVMDYNPANIAPDGIKQGDYFNTTIGPYDYWAIEYGYMFLDAASCEAELPRLKAHASQNTKPELAYATDEDTLHDLDPRVNRFDMSNDTLRFAKERMELSRRLMKRAELRYPEQGESYSQFRNSFARSFNTYANAAILATRYIGGAYIERNFRGDPNEKPPIRPVEGAKQREALRTLRKYVLDENALRFSPATLQKLGIDYNSRSPIGSRPDFPIYTTVSGLQQAVLLKLFSTTVLTRIQENELRALKADQTLTLPELYREVYEAVWSEVDVPANSKPRSISLMRRQLQRGHLTQLIGQYLATDSPLGGDARLLATRQLRRLLVVTTDALKQPGLDEYSQAHLEEVQQRIRKAFQAQISVPL